MPDLERVQQNTPTTLSQQWYDSGVAIDPGAVTIGITRANGTVLVAGGTAAAGAGTNPRTYNLTAIQNSLLDRLTIQWTSPTKGTLTSYLEVVGGFLFSLNEFLADDEVDATAQEAADARTMAERAFERHVGLAFVPRYERERVLGPPYRLKWAQFRSLRDGEFNGTAMSADELDLLSLSGSSLVYSSYYGAYPYLTTQRVTLGYEHGYDFPDPEVSRAVMRLAKHYLTDWVSDDRALRLDTADASYVMAVPGTSRWKFGIPEVDAVANGYMTHGV